ncbi:MAG: hypothetical protein IPL08_13350 [Saprospiraceae bacterium]|nr:hypothetical protein [Saprospiraceae bacterium]
MLNLPISKMNPGMVGVRYIKAFHTFDANISYDIEVKRMKFHLLWPLKIWEMISLLLPRLNRESQESCPGGFRASKLEGIRFVVLSPKETWESLVNFAFRASFGTWFLCLWSCNKNYLSRQSPRP